MPFTDQKCPTVLLADDNVDLLDKIAEILSRRVTIVARALGGHSAVEKALELKPDLILLDISMRDLNGIQVAREVRRQGLQSKIIFLSAHQDPEYVHVARQIGASYVLKAKLYSDLLCAVQEELSGGRFISRVSPQIRSSKLSG